MTRGPVWQAARATLCLAWTLAQSSSVVIAAFLAEGWVPGDADEGVQLWNVGPKVVDLAGWVIDDGEGRAVFGSGAGDGASTQLAPGAWAWVARDPHAFATSFGHPPRWCFAPGCAMRTAGGGPRLADGGDGLRLLDAAGRVVDVVVWGTGDAAIAAEGWHGEPVEPYGGGGLPSRGQVLYRKLALRTEGQEDGPLGAADAVAAVAEAATSGASDGASDSASTIAVPPATESPSAGAFIQRVTSAAAVDAAPSSALSPGPVPDTDRAADWASDPRDPRLGRRVRFPGWDLEGRTRPQRTLARTSLELAIAPDGLQAFLARHWGDARRSIELLAYSFDHPELAELLAERARAGVRVRVLLDGSPVGGVEPDQRWALATMAAAGVELWWMARAGGVRRYRSAHAKLSVVDGLWVLIGTENPSAASAPTGGASFGRRGAWLATDAPAALDWAAGIVARDLDPAHPDVQPWQARDPRRGAPAPGYAPPRGLLPGAIGAPPPRWADAVRDRGVRMVEMITAPENALSDEGGLLGLVAAAGPGDTLRVAQMREARWWGDPSEGAVALNPRLVAYLDAARRGARVWVLLDRYFDDAEHPNSNAAAARWLNAVAATEGLDLEARVGNPAGAGIHAKVVLLRLDGGQERSGAERPFGSRGTEDIRADDAYRTALGSDGKWVHVGSLNGSEAASKANREVALQVGSAALHDRLATVFDADWAASPPGRVWLPVLGVGGR